MTVVANNININNTKAIVFDWDGTLYNNTVAIKAAMKDVLEEYNINYPLNEAVKQAFDIIEGIDSSNMSKVILNAYRISDNIPFLKDLQYIDKLKLILKLYINYKHYISKSQLY
ncbi:MAG: HAD hydrolase-like protein, partial [Candidatus Helarchaeota archaeon]